MSVSLAIDGEQRDPVGVALIGMPTAHGLHQVVDGVLRLGRSEPPPGRTMANLIARDEEVYIPADMADEFSLGILPRLADVVPVEIEEGLFTPPTVLGPISVLTIKMTGTGVRAYWSTRYDVNDQYQDFDPDSPAQLTGYRDAAAEDLAWERVTPALQAVAAASRTWKRQAAQHASSAAAAASMATLRMSVDLTMAEAAVLCGEILPQLDCRDAFMLEIDDRAPNFRAAGSDPQLEFSSDDGELAPNDWFNLNIAVQVDGHAVPLSDVIVELASGATHMLLPNGVYFRLDTPELLRLRGLLEEARALGEIDNT
jgi:hypothetical protein